MTLGARRLFVAGATGVVGREVCRQAERAGMDVLPHVRPKSAPQARELAARGAVLDLEDGDALLKALSGCTTVLQLIGTMRKRFSSGDTYESSDVGTTRLLVEAAKTAGIDHIVLLSSVGAGRPLGAYLKAKARAEALVKESGVPWTIFRPSAFEGENRRPPPGFGALTRALGLMRLRPIAVPDLARALLHVARERAPLEAILEGRFLWALVAAAPLPAAQGAPRS